jgi:hypothetical protein
MKTTYMLLLLLLLGTQIVSSETDQEKASLRLRAFASQR